MIVKHYFGECRSDSRHSDWESMKGVFFLMCPNQKHNQKNVQNGYKHMAGRTLEFKMVKKDVYICTLHFVRLRTEIAYHTPQGFELDL